ncbi:MAG: MFS transporter [Oscillospiraceae bacterium]|nr:MFS transporter [Oscillospiraceae bacterium]
MAKFDAKKLAETVFGAEENSAAKIDPAQLEKHKETAAKMYHTRQLSTKEMIFFGLNSLGSTIANKINDNYRQLFNFNILKINPLYVILVDMLIGIYDVLNNPIMGILYDRTRTRWGKARPYALLTPIPYYASTAILYCGGLFFAGNNDVNDPSKVIFLFSMLFLRETFSTIYGIPTGNLTTLISPNPEDRIQLGLVQTYFWKYSGDILAGVLMPFIELVNKGYINSKSGAGGVFAIVCLVGASIGALTSVLMSWNSRERVILQPKPAATTKTLFYFLKNKYVMRNFIAGLSTGWWSSGGYNWDVIFQQEVCGGAIKASLFYIPRQTMQIVTLRLIESFKRLNHGDFRTTCLQLRGWDLLVQIAQGLIGAAVTKDASTWWKSGIVFGVTDGLNVLNDGPASVMEGEIGREISDYTEYLTGERPDGTFGLITGLIGKVMAPLNTAFTLLVLKWSGYNPTLTILPYSQGSRKVYQKVVMLYAMGGILPSIVNCIPLFFYDLTGEKKEKMYIALNERRALVAKQQNQFEDLDALAAMLARED